MLIETYELEIQLSTHSPDELEYEAFAHLNIDLSPVLPYLNAILPRAIYSPKGPALSWRYEEHKVGFWADHIAVDHTHSKDEAQDVIAHLVNMINDTWSKRHQLTPDTKTRQFLQPLELHRLLPKTNCRLCGESTCFNFALKLAAGQAKMGRCEPLMQEPAYEANRHDLEALLARKSPSL